MLLAENSMSQHAQTMQDRMYADVLALTSLKPARNYKNLSSLDSAANYIFKELEKLDCQVAFQPFEVEGRKYKNIIGTFNPQKGQRIVIGAHYDVYGEQEGADDNASGVAGLLETARLIDQFQKSGKKSDYQIDIVAYTLEEPPYFASENMGSAVHAKMLFEAKIPLRLMICYEMIGYFSDKANSQSYPDPALQSIFPSTANFIAVVGTKGQDISQKFKQKMEKKCQIPIVAIDFPSKLDVGSSSDHRNYWAYDYPAIMINDTSFFRNPNYHKTYDRIGTLNFEKMAEVVKGVTGAILGW